MKSERTFNRRLISLIISFVLVCSVFSNVSFADSTPWDCPECGRTGNTDNYCGNCLHPAPWLEGAPEFENGSGQDKDHNSIYEDAIQRAGNDLANLNVLQDTVVKLEQTGAYSFSKSYLLYFRQIIEIQSANPDYNTVILMLEVCDGAQSFTEDLKSRQLPSCTELIAYVKARILENEGKYKEAFSSFREITILDAPDRAKDLAIIVSNTTPTTTVKGTKEAHNNKTTTVTSWKKLQQEINKAKKGAVIVLKRDLVANHNDSCIDVPAGKDITIDLNGHTLNRNCQTIQDNGMAILVNSDASLTIINSVKGGKITGGKTKKGGAIHNNGTLIINGITICGNKAEESGGGIFIDLKASLDISSSEIRDNTVDECGGGIFSWGSLTVSDCNIHDNAAYKSGAGIWSSGSALMDSVKISSNTGAINGGGIANHGKMTMINCKIRNHSVSAAGGAVFHGNNGNKKADARLELNNTLIENNSASKYGGGLYIDNDTVELIEKTVIKSNLSKQGGGVYYNSGDLLIQGLPIITDNTNDKTKKNNLFISKGKKITINGLLKNGASVGIMFASGTGIFTRNYSQYNSREPSFTFFSDSGNLIALKNQEAAIVK